MSGALYLCGGDERVYRQPCPKGGADHTPAPNGYIEWHDWASRMRSQRRVNRKCPTCGLYGIVLPAPEQEATP